MLRQHGGYLLAGAQRLVFALLENFARLSSALQNAAGTFAKPRAKARNHFQPSIWA
jgi:hypothetical protein